jgi:pimeloyl-ACP methyl ester carboxylesterase
LGGLARLANLRPYVQASLKRQFFDDTRVSEEMVARDWLLLRRAGNREVLRARLAHHNSDAVSADLGAVTMPTLLLWGAEDEVAPVKSAARYQEALPEAALVVFESVGHAVQAEAPMESAAVVHTFLKGEPVGALADAGAMKRVYGDVPPLPAAPVKPVEIRVLGPVARDTPAAPGARLPSP